MSEHTKYEQLLQVIQDNTLRAMTEITLEERVEYLEHRVLTIERRYIREYEKNYERNHTSFWKRWLWL